MIRLTHCSAVAVITSVVALTVVCGIAEAQQAAPAVPSAAPRFVPPPQVVSPEVASDGRITFRIHAPNAAAVRLSASDIPGLQGPTAAQATTAAKGENGIWSVTVGPVVPGAYRYTFNVDGVSVIDPRNPSVSESNNNAWSLVVVPGSPVFDTADVPHGAVAAVTYKSKALGAFRRMHVYTPPGYENGTASYPVFYLLHGAGDCDDSWTSVGRAGFILDNLIATKKAKPMVVVMPAGHAAPAGVNAIGASATNAFVNDFVGDVMPYIESHYRVLTGRRDTAIAGLSMGGGQTLQVAIPRLERFGYIAVFSSGLIGAFPELMPQRPGAPATGAARGSAAPTAAEWEQANAKQLADPKLKNGLALLWFATGKEDFLLTTTQATVDLLKKHGFTAVFRETDGGHTWLKWRDYLAELAPQLFR